MRRRQPHDIVTLEKMKLWNEELGLEFDSIDSILEVGALEKIESDD